MFIFGVIVFIIGMIIRIRELFNSPTAWTSNYGLLAANLLMIAGALLIILSYFMGGLD